MPVRPARRNTAANPKDFGPKRSPEKEEAALAVIRAGYSMAKAATAIGVSRETLQNWRDDDKSDFARRFKDAQQHGADIIEDEAVRRAVEGVDKAVFHQGEVVGHHKEFSDGLMTLMLRGLRPERYNTERHEHAGPGQQPIQHVVEVTFVKGKK